MLKAVIEAGCDAVYLAGYMYGARSFANNFSNEEIIEAINYAHLHGVKVYVTVNTLIYEDEIQTCMNYIEFLHKNNVDAILIQDLGILDLVRKTYPNLELHASTQMHIHNIEASKLMEKLGVKRVVLARETSIDDIKKIKQNTNIQIETFIHGALCVSYSGQCLMSSLIGSRSGNRGTCAGCCREKYDLLIGNKKVNTNTYLLSMKDLNTIENIDKLIEAGIDSLKIEGRTKRIEYAYLVTKLYRKAIDNYYEYKKTLITKEDIKDLSLIFNRNFTNGYILNNTDVINNYRPNHMGVEIGKVINKTNKIVQIKLIDTINHLDGIRILNKKEDIGLTVQTFKCNNKTVKEAFSNDIIEIPLENDVDINDIVVKTTDINRLNQLSKEIKQNTRKVLINCRGKIKIGEKIKLSFDDNINEVNIISDYIVEKSVNNKTNDKIKEQLNKLGNTIYKINNFDLQIDDNVFIPIQVLNDLRRKLTTMLNDKRLYKIPFIKKEYQIQLNDYKKEENINYLITKNYHEGHINFVKEQDYHLLNKGIKKLNNVITHHKEYDELLLISELGSLNKYKNFYTDYTFNVTNSYAVAFLHSMGSQMVTLSYELNDNQIESLIKNYINRYHKKPNLELIIKGHELVMTSKYNMLKEYKANEATLLDKYGNKFNLKIENDLLKIYNFKTRNLSDTKKYFNMGINNLRINEE